MNNTDAALRHLEAALSIDPRHVRALTVLGALHQARGRVDDAASLYGAALEVAPALAEPWTNFGRQHMPSLPLHGTTAGMPLGHPGVACVGRGAASTGTAAACMACELEPLQWLLQFNAGVARLAQGCPAAALPRLSAALGLKPDFAPAYLHLALALDALGESSTAMGALDKCMALQEEGAGDVALHFNYAVVALNAGRMDVAQQQYAAFVNALRSHEVPALAARRGALEAVLNKSS